MADYTPVYFYSIFGSDTDFYEEALDKQTDLVTALKANQELRAEVYRLKSRVRELEDQCTRAVNQKVMNELTELRIANQELQAENKTLTKACEYWSGKHKAVKQQLVDISKLINLKA